MLHPATKWCYCHPRILLIFLDKWRFISTCIWMQQTQRLHSQSTNIRHWKLMISNCSPYQAIMGICGRKEPFVSLQDSIKWHLLQRLDLRIYRTLRLTLCHWTNLESPVLRQRRLEHKVGWHFLCHCILPPTAFQAQAILQMLFLFDNRNSKLNFKQSFRCSSKYHSVFDNLNLILAYNKLLDIYRVCLCKF